MNTLIEQLFFCQRLCERYNRQEGQLPSPGVSVKQQTAINNPITIWLGHYTVVNRALQQVGLSVGCHFSSSNQESLTADHIIHGSKLGILNRHGHTATLMWMYNVYAHTDSHPQHHVHVLQGLQFFFCHKSSFALRMAMLFVRSSLKYLNNYWLDCHKLWYMYPQCPEDDS